MLFGISVIASDIKFFSGTHKDALTKANKEKKLIFIDAYTEWCHWCKVMDKEVFSTDEVSEYLNKNFVPMRWDMEKDFGITLAMKYKVRSYPSFIVLRGDGQLVSLVSGYMPKDDFVSWLESCMQNQEANLYPGISPVVDIAYPEFYKNLYSNSKKSSVKIDHNDVMNYLSQQEDLTNEINWAVLYSFNVPKYDDQFLNAFATYKELYGKSECENKVMKIVYQKLKKAAEEKNDDMMAESVMMIEKYIEEDKEKLIIGSMIDYYGKTNKWNEYASNVNAMVELMREDKIEEVQSRLNSYSWNVYENCNDSEVIHQSLGWMSKVIEGSNDYSYIDTYAALLFKSGQYGEAEQYANKAIELGKQSGEDVTETEELLKKIKSANNQ